MTDESVNYDIQQVQHDIERLQRDLSRLHNDAASPAISSRYEPAVLYDPLHAEEVVAYERITTPGSYENQDWLPTSIPAISMIDEEIAQAEWEEAQQALTTAREILKDADIASVLANSNMENINMINTTSRSQKIRNAIAALLAAASTLIAAEAGAMYSEENKKSESVPMKFFSFEIENNLYKNEKTILEKISIHNATPHFISCKEGDILGVGDNIKIVLTFDELFEDFEYKNFLKTHTPSQIVLSNAKEKILISFQPLKDQYNHIILDGINEKLITLSKMRLPPNQENIDYRLIITHK